MHKFERNMRIHILRIFVLLSISVLIAGCATGRLRPNMKKADDEISKAIYEKVGKKVSYEGMDETRYGVLQYSYLILDDEDENVLADMTEAINEVLDENGIGKVELIIWEEGHPGAYSSVICLSNFNLYITDSYQTVDDSQYGYLYYLSIYGNDGNEDSSYNQPSSYPVLEGIEYLHVIEDVNKNAEEEGIDWYEIFPDLKGYEVYAGWVNGKYSDEIIYQEMKEDEVSENYEETEAP